MNHYRKEWRWAEIADAGKILPSCRENFADKN
jgi:hypothetical protein